MVASLCEQRIAGYGDWQKVADVPAAPVHDPLTVAYLVDPTVITDIEDAPCVVDCGRGAAYGVTLFDIRNAGPRPRPELPGGPQGGPGEVCGYPLPAAGVHQKVKDRPG